MARADHAERIAPLTDERHEIGRVREPDARPDEPRIVRQVAAERDDVLDALRDHRFEQDGDLVARVTHTRHVRGALDAERLDAHRELDRRLARLGARPRDRHERRRNGRSASIAHERGLAVGRGRRKNRTTRRGAARRRRVDSHARVWFEPLRSSDFTRWCLR
jgi:hypothetical protein